MSRRNRITGAQRKLIPPGNTFRESCRGLASLFVACSLGSGPFLFFLLFRISCAAASCGHQEINSTKFFVPLLWACPLIFAVFPELTKPQTDEAAFGCCVGCDNFSSRGSQQKGRALARGTSADSPVRGSPARVTSTGRYGVPTNDMYKIYNKQYGFFE